MVQCPVCGRTYGVTHSCTGPVATVPVWAARWSAPAGFAPLHYFRQALEIARLDDGAVLAASRDNNAVFYGAIIWLVGQVLVLVGSSLTAGRSLAQLNWLAVFFGGPILLVLDASLMLAQYAVCHLLARRWFGARGSYAGLLRPLLLGSLVTWLGVIPYMGMLIVGIWGVAVMMIVFENVDEIERLKAFMLSCVVGVIFLTLTRMLLAPR